jgi:hypothetical protein
LGQLPISIIVVPRTQSATCSDAGDPERGARAVREEGSMSDISLNWSAADLAALALLICWPGLAVGLVVGALGWPGHRWWGGALGAAAGFVLLGGYWHVYLASNLSLDLGPARAAWSSLGVAWPGPILGALAGAALWRPQRLSGALFGACAGFVLWLHAWYSP